MNRFKGFVYGMIASSTFGLIPLFTLPMMGEGLTTDSILTYRMFLACLLVALLMWVRGVSLRTNLRELRWFAFLGFFYYGSAALLFQGYHTMSSGMATTLHFLYPIGTTLIMAIVFRQRTSIYTVITIALGLSGVALLSLRGGVGQTTSVVGVLLVLLSGFSYAIYLVTVNNVRRYLLQWGLLPRRQPPDGRTTADTEPRGDGESPATSPPADPHLQPCPRESHQEHWLYADLRPRGYGAPDGDRHGGALPRGASLLGDAPRGRPHPQRCDDHRPLSSAG